MRILLGIVGLLPFLSFVSAQEKPADAGAEKLEYQSDVARLRKIVIESLYSHRDVFLRELISNSNDAIEKLRMTALKDKSIDLSSPLNITIKMVKDEDDDSVQRKLVITDTGIGMSPDELKANLGTLAKSGTTEFLARAEGENAGNLIGQFGLGFYSSFLVAEHVYVASRPPPSVDNPDPVQHVFSSAADEGSFDVYPDPRGNTLHYGTEITLVLKKDAKEYCDSGTIQNLVEKHSAFSTSYPIYLFDRLKYEVPVPDGYSGPGLITKDKPVVKDEDKPVVEDEDEAIIEDLEDEPPKQQKYAVHLEDKWLHLNEQPPLWMRDPKSVTEDEYKALYRATWHDYSPPLAWYQFNGDASGTSFRALFYVPSYVPADFWNSNKPMTADVRLLVKRVFITNDLGEDTLPKWMSWLKVIVDADDLPLHVSRETLQQTRFLRQLRSSLIKRFVNLMTKIAEEEPERFAEISATYNPIFKLGALDDDKEEGKLAALARWDTNQRNSTSLDEYVANRKKGQTQIFYIAGIGQSAEALAQSVFVEKLTARGYEVLLFPEPLDEILANKLRKHSGMRFQDVAKQGLKFGDEDEDAEEEKARQKELEEEYKPLTEWLTKHTKDVVTDVKISQRLVTTPCAIVAHESGYSANMERLMKAQTQRADKASADWFRSLKTLEINPKSPLIEGLLRRVEQLPEDGEPDEEAEADLREVVAILIDTALVRSGFDVADPNAFFTRVDHVLRRSLGVSLTAKADAQVKPAPPVETGPVNIAEEEDEATGPGSPSDPFAADAFMDWKDFKREQAAKGAPIDDSIKVNVDIERDAKPAEEVVPENADEAVETVVAEAEAAETEAAAEPQHGGHDEL